MAKKIETAKPIDIQIEHDMPKKVLAKSVHLGLGVDLLGSQTSLTSKRGNELEVTHLGIKATGKTGRVVLIPWANIKGVELESK